MLPVVDRGCFCIHPVVRINGASKDEQVRCIVFYTAQKLLASGYTYNPQKFTLKLYRAVNNRVLEMDLQRIIMD